MGVPGLFPPMIVYAVFFSALRIWNEHIRVSSTLIKAAKIAIIEVNTSGRREIRISSSEEF